MKDYFYSWTRVSLHVSKIHDNYYLPYTVPWCSSYLFHSLSDASSFTHHTTPPTTIQQYKQINNKDTETFKHCFYYLLYWPLASYMWLSLKSSVNKPLKNKSVMQISKFRFLFLDCTGVSLHVSVLPYTGPQPLSSYTVRYKQCTHNSTHSLIEHNR